MPDLDELLSSEPSWAAAGHAHPPAFADLRARAVRRRRTRRGAYAAGVAAVVAAVVIGAAVLPGGDSRPEPAPAPSPRGDVMLDLADRVYTYGDWPDVVVVDLAAARTSLGLPADAFPGGGSGDGDWEAWKELPGVSLALPYLGSPDTTLLEAIDAGRITAAASTMVTGVGGLTVVRTSQDFDSIADRLEAAGFERAGNLLTYVGAPPHPSGYRYLAGTNGLLAMSSDFEDGARRVQDAVSAAGPPRTMEGRVLADIHLETQATGVMLVQPRDSDCVRAVVGVETAAGDEELVLIGDDPASVDLDMLEGLVGSPVPDGDRIRIPVEASSGDDPHVGPLALLAGDLQWRCG